MKNPKRNRIKESPFKNIVVVFRPDSPAAKKSANELHHWLKDRGLNVFSHPKQRINGWIKPIKAQQHSSVDLAIVLGGDGTYLQAVRLLREHRTPVLGINMGSLGFLTMTRKEHIYSAIAMTLDQKMERRFRAMIDIAVLRGGKIISKDCALNDLVIERGALSHLINIAVFSENHLVAEVKADGLVIATPTGSTAYNLAAGGPILHPDVRGIVVSPVCPHSLTHRPIIFPDDKPLTFKVLNKEQKAFLTVDGQSGEALKPGDDVIVTRSKYDHVLLRNPDQNYFDLLREKLKFGER